ncbi:MAG: hypothetical protein ABIK82_15505 [Pseudomonadota bacterium]
MRAIPNPQWFSVTQAEDLMRQAEAARKAEIGAAIADIKEKMAT